MVIFQRLNCLKRWGRRFQFEHVLILTSVIDLSTLMKKSGPFTKPNVLKCLRF